MAKTDMTPRPGLPVENATQVDMTLDQLAAERAAAALTVDDTFLEFLDAPARRAVLHRIPSSSPTSQELLERYPVLAWNNRADYTVAHRRRAIPTRLDEVWSIGVDLVEPKMPG